MNLGISLVGLDGCLVRWLPVDAPPRLALELAKALSAAGCEDQSWLEMATACGGSRADLTEIHSWAQVLGVEVPALRQLAGRLVGPPADRVTVLTEAVAELGRYQLADCLAAAGPSYAASPDERAAPSTPRDLATEADMRLLMDWFRGRDGVHATDALTRAGHRSFVPVHRPIAAEDWMAHPRHLAKWLVLGGAADWFSGGRLYTRAGAGGWGEDGRAPDPLRKRPLPPSP